MHHNSRIKSLPDDLADYATDEARGLGANVLHADKWTEENWHDVDDILNHVESHAAYRLRSLMASVGAAGVLDARREALVRIVTGGRTETASKVTGPEARHVAAWCDRVALCPNTTPPIEPYAPDWKAEAKAMGVTQADLLERGEQWRKAHRVHSPEALADHRIIGGVLWRAGDGASAIGEAWHVLEEVDR